MARGKATKRKLSQPYKDKKVMKETAAACGRVIWGQFDDVYILTTNHRQNAASPSAKRLLQFCNLFMQEHPLPDLQLTRKITEMCDLLQTKVVPSLRDLASQDPHALVLRNSVRVELNRVLAVNRANFLGVRMVFWWCKDRVKNAALPPKDKELLAARLRAANASNTEDIASLGYFFPGIHYLFIDNNPALQEAGWVRNNRCTGRRLVLHPSEPADNLTLPYRLLEHPPLGIFVEPAGVDLQMQLFPNAPPGCVPVLLKPEVTFSFDGVTIQRSGIPLGDGYTSVR
jgi:hypothetical protein